MDWRHLFEIITAARAARCSLINFCVCVKPRAGLGSFYRSQHELVLVLKAGRAPHRNNVELGRHGRNRSNVWSYPGGDIVLDAFLGSGSTLIAAEKTGRRCFALELDPLYVDVAIRRWQALSGKAAVCAATGETFDQRRAHLENADVDADE